MIDLNPEININTNDMIKHFFFNFLFHIERENNNEQERDSNKSLVNLIKCKAPESRKMVSNLIIKLIKNTETFIYFSKNCLNPLFELMESPKTWNYNPVGEVKSFWGFVGIKNLGCICYMIAILQQFYMCPSFRYAILTANDQIEKNMVYYEKYKCEIDDNLLHQLKNLFGFKYFKK